MNPPNIAFRLNALLDVDCPVDDMVSSYLKTFSIEHTWSTNRVFVSDVFRNTWSLAAWENNKTVILCTGREVTFSSLFNQLSMPLLIETPELGVYIHFKPTTLERREAWVRDVVQSVSRKISG